MDSDEARDEGGAGCEGGTEEEEEEPEDEDEDNEDGMADVLDERDSDGTVALPPSTAGCFEGENITHDDRAALLSPE